MLDRPIDASDVGKKFRTRNHEEAILLTFTPGQYYPAWLELTNGHSFTASINGIHRERQTSTIDLIARIDDTAEKKLNLDKFEQELQDFYKPNESESGDTLQSISRRDFFAGQILPEIIGGYGIPIDDDQLLEALYEMVRVTDAALTALDERAKP